MQATEGTIDHVARDVAGGKGVAAQPAEGRKVLLDGNSLNLEDFMLLRTGSAELGLTDVAWLKVEEGRQVIDDLLERKQVAYGINTGFGNFANVLISPDKLRELQENLIRSHASGTGEPLSIEQARGLMVLRINVMAKGYSGISRTTLEQLITAFNKSCLSFVPAKGTVGASGDLAPLSHLALGLMGEGQLWDPQEQRWAPAAGVLEKYGLRPLALQPKEGLALINGTQLITSLGTCAGRAFNDVHSPTAYVLSRACPSQVPRLSHERSTSLCVPMASRL